MKPLSPPTTTVQAATRKPRALIVPEEVLVLEGITLTAKLILAEVIDLHKVSGNVFASDEHFANRLGIGLRTVGDAIKQLQDAGLIVRIIKPSARHKRVLTPALPTPDALANSKKFLQNPHAQAVQVPADSAGSACEICDDSLQNPQGVPAKSAAINTKLNSTSNSNLNSIGSKAAHAVPTPKKIEQVEEELATSQTTAPSSPQVAPSPPSSPPNSKRRIPKHPFSESPYADAELFVAALEGTDYEHADLRYYHEVIRTWAKSKDARNADWLPMMCNWMIRDAKEHKLKTTTSSFSSSHVNTNYSPSHRRESLDDLGTAVDQYCEAKYGH